MATVCAVFAHPDDETFICGGTLAKYAAEGHHVTLVCATKGEMGRRMGVPPTATRETIAALRTGELSKACEALGVARITWLGYRDKTLEIQPASVLTESLLAHLQEEQPDVVITFHGRFGGHPDHCTIGAATTRAYQRYARTREGTQLLFVAWANMVQQAASFGLSKADFKQVDVKKQLPEKLRAYRAHRTQSQLMKWLWKKDSDSQQKLSNVEYFIPYHSSVLEVEHTGRFR